VWVRNVRFSFSTSQANMTCGTHNPEGVRASVRPFVDWLFESKKLDLGDPPEHTTSREQENKTLLVMHRFSEPFSHSIWLDR
jgi:hypothetical protein